MTLKLKNLQFRENIPANISCKSKDSSCDDTVNFFQTEGSSMKTKHDDNVIPLKLKTSRKVYTRKGDLGKCNLLSGERVMKDADQVEACGDVDELNSILGLLVNVLPQKASKLSIEIEQIQESLFQIGALIATDPNSPLLNRLKPVSREQIRSLEQSIDSMEEQLPEIKKFIIPGGHVSAAQANVARSVCRRAERHVIKTFTNYNLKELPDSMKTVLAYLNRLSDYLFVVGRYCNFLINSVERKNSFAN